MTLSITQKIACAIISIVLASIATLSVVTSHNLQLGFIDYLNQVQAEQLDELSAALTRYYRRQGSFDGLRRNPRALTDALDGRDSEPARYAHRPPPAPVPDADRGPQRPPPAADTQQGEPPPPAQPRPGPVHALIVGPRLSLVDAAGRPVIGPPDHPRSITSDIMVDGQRVGVLSLAPMQKISDANGLRFVRSQIRDLAWLAGALILLSVLLALALARHLLRPVATLRAVTQSIARGELGARAPVINQDELGALAGHVNSMAQSLERNDQQRRKMLADIAHELRTPLTVMRGEVEALQDGVRNLDLRAIDSLHGEILQLSKLIDDLHQLALTDSGDLQYRRERVDLSQLLTQVVARFQPRAASAGLTLTVVTPRGAPTLYADPGRLTQVISNLLENSLRYTDAGGSVAVRLGGKVDQAELIIEDSAPGVPPDEHARLFERLYRSDPARARVTGGSGLGLSICEALVQAHRGRIFAGPSPLGGLRITLLLPLADMRRAP